MISKVFITLLFSFYFLLFLHPLEGDGDFYHHLHTGKYVLENFSLPKIDEWTFTARGQPWIAHSWATGVLFYLIYSSWGVWGISLLVALIGLLTLILIFALFKSYHLKNSLIYPLLLILASLFLIRFPSRPEIFSYPLLVTILLIDSLNRPRLYLFLPLIIFFWSILYGANVLVGLGILVFLLVKRLRQTSLILVICIIISLSASFLNGYGLDSIFYILRISSIQKFQGEWLGILPIFQKAPPDFLDLFKFRILIYGLFISLYLGLVITHVKLIRNYLWEFVLSLAVFLPLFTFRQAGLAAILSLPFLSVILKNHLFLWILSILSVLITLFYNPPRLALTEDPGMIKLASFISHNNLSGNVFTSQQIGSYVSFRFFPKILVSYDTRDDLFMGGKFLNDLLSPAPVELILNRYRADLVILDTKEETQKATYLLHSTTWIKLYLEDNFLVMKRK